MAVAEEERRFDIDTKETVQSAKRSLEVPIMVNWLKPELAVRWARLAPYAKDIGKSPTMCLDTAKLILESVRPNVITQEEKSELNALYSSIAKAYFIIAGVQGALGFNFESSLESAYDSARKVSDLERAFDISLLAIVVKYNLGVPVGHDIKRVRKMAFRSRSTEPFPDVIFSHRLLNLAQVEFSIKLSPEDTLQLARKLSSEDTLQSFLNLIQIARFEKLNGLDSTKTLFLARQAVQDLGGTNWGDLEKVIFETQEIKGADGDYTDYITVDQAQKTLKHANNSYQKWLALQDLIRAQIREGVPSLKAFEEVEALSSSLQNNLRVQSLLRLAELAAEAGINPISYTDKARHIVYQQMIKSYKTGELLGEITETEMKVARVLIKRCHSVLAQIGQAEAEALICEAIRLNDQDCIRALGAFLPREIQDKITSQETKNLLLAGRAMRGIW